MAGFSSQQTDHPITGINVTPLVDIVLVLLIIFMVTAKLVVSRALPMDLPQAESDGEVQSPLTVAIDVAGRTTIEGAAMDDDQALLDRAQRARQDTPSLRAVIHADGGVEHRRVMAVLDLLRQAGVEQVGFGVEHAALPTAGGTP